MSAARCSLPLFLREEQYIDIESGLIYLRARYYDPRTAQFVQKDPLVAITARPYGYADDNPVNEGDPSGEWCGLDFFQSCDPRCSDSVQPLGPWECAAAIGVIIANIRIGAPISERLAPILNYIATSCSAGAIESGGLSEVCAAIAGGALNYTDLSLMLAGHKAPTDVVKDLLLQIPGLALSSASDISEASHPNGSAALSVGGHTSDLATGVYGMSGTGSSSCQG